MTTKPMIKDYQMVIHLSMSKYHQSKHTGIIEWDGNPCNGKMICIESITPKTKTGNFKKSKQTIYISEKGSPEFNSIQDFINHYQTTTPSLPGDNNLK